MISATRVSPGSAPRTWTGPTIEWGRSVSYSRKSAAVAFGGSGRPGHLKTTTEPLSTAAAGGSELSILCLIPGWSPEGLRRKSPSSQSGRPPALAIGAALGHGGGDATGQPRQV